MKPDLVVLFSGGADSTLLLKMAEKVERTPLALMIDYGQKHINELKFAKKYLDKHKIENMTIKISGYDVNSALTGSGEKGIYEGVDIHNVPARNTIFLAFAYGIAESKGIQEIWYGPNWQDYEHIFPDCYQQYIGRMNSVLEISGVRPIKVYAPLLGMPKELIMDILEKQYGIGKENLYSGYGEFA
jgi:7-cyano-7-deazaguanine synthase